MHESKGFEARNRLVQPGLPVADIVAKVEN